MVEETLKKANDIDYKIRRSKKYLEILKGDIYTELSVCFKDNSKDVEDFINISKTSALYQELIDFLKEKYQAEIDKLQKEFNQL